VSTNSPPDETSRAHARHLNRVSTHAEVVARNLSTKIVVLAEQSEVLSHCAVTVEFGAAAQSNSIRYR